jgi:hypothetical protein
MFSVSCAASVQLGLADALPATLPDQLIHQVSEAVSGLPISVQIPCFQRPQARLK